MTPVTPSDFSEIRWRGHWIWTEPPAMPTSMFSFDGGPRDEAHGLFRKTFTLESVPARVPARITADSRYALYANGQEVFRGPVRSQPRRLHYDLFDLAPYLKPGENVLAVYVKYYGSPTSFWIPAPAGMTLGKTGVLAFEADLGGGNWLVSDDTWKALKSDAWAGRSHGSDMVGGGVPVEVFDAGRFPAAWREAGFDDSSWANASKIPVFHIGGTGRSQPPSDPYGPLYPRPIARLEGEVIAPVSVKVETLADAPDPSVNNPVTVLDSLIQAAVTDTQPADRLPVTVDVPQGGAVRLTLDLGRIVSGLPQFEVEAPAGTVFDFSYKEDPLVRSEGFLGQHSGTRYTARGSDDRFQVFDSNGLRYVYIAVHGTAGPVTVKSFAVKESIYPWSAGASFECSDPALNDIYKAGIRTVNLNSHDAFLDCPTREQRAWVGDSVVHQMVHLATNTDWRLAWHYLTLGNSPRYDGILPMSVAGEIEASGGVTIPDWSLHWVHGVYNLYRFTGDRQQVKTFMPTVERILRWYEPFQGSNGLLKDLVEWNLVDWSSVSNLDTPAIINGLWARGLREFAEMAGWLEEKGSQAWAEDVYAKVKAGFEAFWDEERGAYVDHIVDGACRPEMSQLAGAAAIVSGLAPQERWTRIIERITDPARLVERSWMAYGQGSPEDAQRKAANAMMGIYEIDWDAENEVVLVQPFMQYVVHDAVAAAGLADQLPELYRRWSQFLETGYDTIGECWSWGTHVHGWSCTPVKDMVFYTLGVTPAEPGYTAARVAPRLGRLAWAKGSVPTPHGLIKVEAAPGKVTVESPVPVVVELPGKEPQRLDAGRHEVSG